MELDLLAHRFCDNPAAFHEYEAETDNYEAELEAMTRDAIERDKKRQAAPPASVPPPPPSPPPASAASAGEWDTIADEQYGA